jgi:hypothetical protein
MIIMGEGKYTKMHIERNVALFNTACNIIHTMKLKDMPNEELFVLIDHMRTVATAEFPAPEEKSPIIVPPSVTEDVVVA